MVVRRRETCTVRLQWLGVERRDALILGSPDHAGQRMVMACDLQTEATAFSRNIWLMEYERRSLVGMTLMGESWFDYCSVKVEL